MSGDSSPDELAAAVVDLPQVTRRVEACIAADDYTDIGRLRGERGDWLIDQAINDIRRRRNEAGGPQLTGEQLTKLRPYPSRNGVHDHWNLPSVDH